MHNIEKGIAVPSNTGKRGRHPKYPFESMEVGDSFFVADATRSAIATAASLWGHRCQATFTCRKDGYGFRVWRIS